MPDPNDQPLSAQEIELASSHRSNKQNKSAAHITVDRNDLDDIVSGYVKRTLIEDIQALQAVGGIDLLVKSLHTDVINGLTTTTPEGEHDLGLRAAQYGTNRLPRKELTPFWRLIWDAGADPMLRILLAASVVSLALGISFGERPEIEWIEGAAIFLAVCIVILVTAGNDYYKERQFANLYDHEEKTCTATRNRGNSEKIDVRQLVVGDIIQVEAGDEIPADCLLTTGFNLKVDESSLTGESAVITKKSYDECLMEIQKQETLLDSIQQSGGAQQAGRSGNHHLIASPVLLSGCTITSGTGSAIVIAVGPHSQVGKLFTKLAVDSEPTPLQNKLNALARDVGRAGFAAALLTLAVLVVSYWIAYGVQKEEKRDSPSEIAEAMVGFIVTSITIVVVAVPEGLPLAVTISLAFSVGRMLKDQNYVRRLAACETMGGADEICSDKTGTLTKNQMEVEAFWNGSYLTPDINAYTVEELPLPPDECLTILVVNIAVNSTGYLEKTLVEINDKSGRKKEVVKQVGSPTECALIQFAELLGKDCDAIRHMFTGKDKLRLELLPGMDCSAYSALGDTPVDLVELRIPFSSDRKAMTTVIRHPSNPKLLRVLTKGAAEIVLRLCSQRITEDGKRHMSPEKISKIEAIVINQLAGCALRTICLAYRDFDPEEVPNWRNDVLATNPNLLAIESDMICLGIAGVRDPVRDEVPSAVKICQRAGIRIRMCTGDNLETAKQIALKSNIYHPEEGGIAMLGPDFLKFVGGVICEKCRTDRCPCEQPEINDENNGMESIQVDDDLYGSPRNSACNRLCWSKGRRHGPQPMAKSTRVDVLGNPEAFDSIVDKLEVMARSQPNDKYALVTGLRNRGHVVAVTGDGTNDAPALKKADVGFAMGITGKEVAKQAADIVLLDDNFESIVRACKWGRNIYDNIQRFLQFQLTVNVVAVVVAFTGAVLLRGSPLSAVQLLWVNLIMDTFAALALATELPTDKLLRRPPHSRSEYLVSRTMVRNIIAQTTYMVAVLLALIFSGDCWLPEYPYEYDEEAAPDFHMYSTRCGNGRTVVSGRRFHVFSDQQDYKNQWYSNVGPSRHYTYVFNVFVIMQAFNLLNARKIGAHEYSVFSGLLGNHYWMGIMIVIIVGQVILVQFGGVALSVHPSGLTWQQWLISLSFGLGTWIVAFLVKLLPGRVVELLPETANKEINPLDEPTSLAMASRGRISRGRISARMFIRTDYETSAKRTPHITSLQSTGGGSRFHHPTVTSMRERDREQQSATRLNRLRTN